MEIEITRGLIIFASGVFGMAFSIIVGIVMMVCFSRSKNKLKEYLDGVYK